MTLKVDGKQKIAGISILQIRDLLKRSGGGFRADWLTDKGLPEEICGELLQQGYIELNTEPRYQDDSGHQWFDITETGRALMRASGASRIKRTTASRSIELLKQRIELVNSSYEYMVRVPEAVIFGSFATGAETIGDIDFAFRTERKIEKFGDRKEWDAAARADFMPMAAQHEHF